MPEPELSDPKAREEPDEPSQAGGAGLGLNPGTVIEVTTVDSYDGEPRTYTTTLELLEKNLERDLEEYFRREVRSDLYRVLSCDTVREVYSIRLDRDVLVAVLEAGEWVVKRFVYLKSFEHLEREISYVSEGNTLKVGYVKSVKFVKPKASNTYDCYYTLYVKTERIARDIIGDLVGEAG